MAYRAHITILTAGLLFIFCGCIKSGGIKLEDTLSLHVNGEKYKDVEKTSSDFYFREDSFTYHIKVSAPYKSTYISILVSSEGQMKTGLRYPIPTEETPYTWMSYGRLSFVEKVASGFWLEGEEYKVTDENIISGWVKFTRFNQKDDLDRFGKGECHIRGEFEAATENYRIIKGTFDIPYSNYWDTRAMEN